MLYSAQIKIMECKLMNRAACLGLTHLTDDEEKLEQFFMSTANNGKGIKGYSGNMYVNNWLGNVQFIHHALKQEDKYEIIGFDLHSSGNAVWKFRVYPGSIDPPDFNEMEKRVLISRVDGSGGMGVITLLNSDVLPGWGENEVITSQVIAYPEEIHYYSDEDAYAAQQEPWKDGKPLLLAEGSIFPHAFLLNHNPENRKENETGIENDYTDGFVLIRGKVKGIRPGRFHFPDDEKEYTFFYRIVIDTQFGELEIVHTEDQVSEEERPLIKTGSTIFGSFMVFGDCAIYEYENGIVLDEEHDLCLLKNIMDGSSSCKRLHGVLTDRSVYLSEHSNYRSFTGTKEIIERFQYIQDLNAKDKTRFITEMATITSVDEGDEELPYSVGKRCVTLSEEDPKKYQSVTFIDTDEDGKILRLTISKEPRYHFRTDDPPEAASPEEKE